MTKQEFLEKLRAALGNDLSGAVVSENVNYYKQYITCLLYTLTLPTKA